MRAHRFVRRAALLLAAVGLTACGSGGGDTPSPPPLAPPAPSAEEQVSASVAAWLAYTRQRISQDTSETTEARNTAALRPPVSDTGEPSAI